MNQVERIAEKVGGEIALAKLLKVHRSAITHLKHGRGYIPAWRHQEVIDKAKQVGVTITPADFFGPPSNPRRKIRKLQAAAE
jgi:hypothetical protein